MEEQEPCFFLFGTSYAHAVAATNVHGPRLPQLGVELVGAVDSGSEAVGVPDRAAAGQGRRPCYAQDPWPCRQRQAEGVHLGQDTHHADRQVPPAAGVAVAVDADAAAVAVGVGKDGRVARPGSESEGGLSAQVGDREVGAPAEQPGASRERRRRDGGLAASDDERAVGGDAEDSGPSEGGGRGRDGRRRAGDAQLHAADAVREGQGPVCEPQGC